MVNPVGSDCALFGKSQPQNLQALDGSDGDDQEEMEGVAIMKEAEEESKGDSQMRSAPISADLPSFTTVLNGQHSSGYWASS